jgi:hypothetical protein
MRRSAHRAIGSFAVALLTLVVSSAASAQDTTALSSPAAPALPALSSQTGPMVIERIQSGFLVAPEFKVTRFDHKTSELVGGYAGWLYDRTFFIGGGGYWLANNARDRQLAYGGVVVGWQALPEERVGFNVKALIGGGRATLSDTIGDLFDDHFRDDDPFGRHPLISSLANTVVRFREDFFVAEPEADIRVNLTKDIKLTGGVGYRLIGDARRVGDQIRGATGTLAVQVGF